MPIDVSLDVKKGFILRVISGEIAIEEVIESLKDTLNHPDYRPSMKSITDLRELVHKARPVDIQKIARLIMQNTEKVEGGKAAVVVSQKVSFGLMRMLQAFIDKSPFKINSFYTMEDAWNWLDMTEEL